VSRRGVGTANGHKGLVLSPLSNDLGGDRCYQFFASVVNVYVQPYVHWHYIKCFTQRRHLHAGTGKLLAPPRACFQLLDLCKCHVLDTACAFGHTLDPRVVGQDAVLVFGHLYIEFDLVNAQTNGLFEGGNRVFRMMTAGAAMGTNTTRRHDDLVGCHRKRT
jgi:hypothetical protein